MKIYEIEHWQVFQQNDGKIDIAFSVEIDDWLINPATENEINVSKRFYGVRARVVEESSGIAITEWVNEKALDGKWNMLLKCVPAGGPYSVILQLSFFDGFDFDYWASGAIRHVGVGDIYLIAGQSNAVGWAKGTYDDEPSIGVRALYCDGWNMASQPLSVFHSPFLTFGKYLYKRLGYPIGLISRAVGGSAISTWMDGGEHMESLKSENIGAIKGVLWYQGCDDVYDGRWNTYFNNFSNVANEFRKKFSNDKLPIITFQLNRSASSKNDIGYDKIREIQRTIPEKIHDTYVIPTIDLMKMSDGVHNSISSNITLGERSAVFVLDEIYHKLKSPKAPNIAFAKRIDKNKVCLEFSNVDGCLHAGGVDAKRLPICIEDSIGINSIVNYKINCNQITLELSRNLDGNAFVKLHFGSNPTDVILDVETQLPVLCFSGFKIK